MPVVIEKKWREIKRVRTWDEADALRSGVTRDTLSLDVRLRCEVGIYVVEISGPEKR